MTILSVSKIAHSTDKFVIGVVVFQVETVGFITVNKKVLGTVRKVIFEFLVASRTALLFIGSADAEGLYAFGTTFAFKKFFDEEKFLYGLSFKWVVL